VTKDSKAEAAYTPVAMRPEQRCGLCKYYIRFNSTDGDCEKVVGVVKERGWCKHFEKK